MAFGPAFGSADGPTYLTVAYGIYANNYRNDNDYQVLLQYDIGDWLEYERPLTESKPHRAGPAKPAGKYFVLTGNTHFGVQSLEYDPWQERWFLSVYPGSKSRFPNFSLFAIEATTKPRTERLEGSNGEKAAVLSLAKDGLRHEKTGIRGWKRELPFGMQAVDDGLYYLVSSQSRPGQEQRDADPRGVDRRAGTARSGRWIGDRKLRSGSEPAIQDAAAANPGRMTSWISARRSA